tara:strand:+ start:73 stop:483 length:411 start_codon:yes stop_codon:yes gene_type:complete
METYLYFRDVANLAADDDGVAGSLLFPLSSLKGMCMGSGAITGAITEDEDRFAIFFEPAGIGAGDGDIDAGDNDVDVINVDIVGNANNPQPVMQAIVEAANSHPNSDGFIVIYDSITGESVHPNISGLTVVRASND